MSDLRLATLYFATLILLTLPIWLIGAYVDVQLLPGLPIGAIAVICPALAAMILSFVQGGWPAVRGLWARSLRPGPSLWYLVPTLLLNLSLFGLALMASRALGSPAPLPVFDLVHAAILLALFLPTALLEEVGWTGFALPHLLPRLGPLGTALAVGSVWAAWHLPALIQVGRGVEWMAWFCLWTASARVIIVWICLRSGAAVWAAVAYHAMSNLCWQLYPVDGSFFDPRISGLITFAVALVLTFAARTPVARSSA